MTAPRQTWAHSATLYDISTHLPRRGGGSFIVRRGNRGPVSVNKLPLCPISGLCELADSCVSCLSVSVCHALSVGVSRYFPGDIMHTRLAGPGSAEPFFSLQMSLSVPPLPSPAVRCSVWRLAAAQCTLLTVCPSHLSPLSVYGLWGTDLPTYPVWLCF